MTGIPVRTVDLEGLLLTKQTMRAKDIPDRLLLERALDALRESRGEASSNETLEPQRAASSPGPSSGEPER